MTVEAFHCISVVSCLADQYAIAGRLLPGTATERVTDCGRMYSVFRVDHRGEDLKFCDPCDGEVLVECKYFDTETAAHEWIRFDCHLRAWLRDTQTRGIQ
jgi:hypothetical protein